ncbi:MAG: PQQ-binding-like beta-propeller repeat protein [Halobacteriaceae archaeon]
MAAQSAGASEAAAGQTVYVGSSSRTVHALDAATGTERWRFDTGGRVKSSPTVVEGTVYVGSDSAAVFALDAADGTEQWRSDADGYFVEASPTVVNHTVYVGNSGNLFLALDAADGSEKWRFTASEGFPAAPAVTNGTVYVGCNDGNIYALDAADGTEQWRFGTGNLVTTSPTVVGGTVYVGSDDGNLYAINAADGTEQWRFTFSSTSFSHSVRSSPTVVDGTVYVGRDDSNVYAIDVADGTKQWRFETEAEIRSSPTVAGGTVFVGTDMSDGRVYAINADDGTEKWRFKTGNRVRTCPTVLDDTVYIGAMDDNVYALDVADGTERWHFTANYVRSSPTIVADPQNGHSAGSRVNLGTLGHHFEAAGNPPPGVSEAPSFELAAQANSTSVSTGGSVTIALTVENVGTAPGAVGVSLQSVTGPGAASENLLNDSITIAGHTDDGGNWQDNGWQWDDDIAGSDATDISPGDTRQPSVTLSLGEDVETGTYSVAFDAVRDGSVVDTATTTIEVTPEPAVNRVKSIEGTPVRDAEVSAYITNVHVPSYDPSEDPNQRHVTTVTTDEEGVFELPTEFADSDRELLVTARRGDWFTTERYDPQELDSPADYGSLTLDRQQIFGPEVARSEDGSEFGAGSVWRFLFSEDLHVFYIEVTNTNEYDGEAVWKISEASVPGGGPAGGDFLFAFPEDDATVAEDSAYTTADPTGTGGVDVLAIGPSDTSGESLPELLHPLRRYMNVPLYAAMRKQPEEALRQDWHVVTEASSERARQISERLRQGLKLPGKICSKLSGIPCGPGFLLSIMDKLTYINRLLQGERRIAEVAMTPHAPRAGGEVAKGVFDVWKPDDVALDQVYTESSVAYQVPVRVETDEPITYSVQTEWARPFNDLGKFSGTFTTAAIDVAITRPNGPLTPGDEYYVDVRLRNRSLESRTITDLTVETSAEVREITPNVELAPGETTRVPIEGGGFVAKEGKSETQLDVSAVTADGTTFTQTNRIGHAENGSKRDIDVETTGQTDPLESDGSTGSDGTGVDQLRNDEAASKSSGGVHGFGVLSALAAGGSALASRLWADDGGE